MPLDPRKPFNELADLPPPFDLETKAVLKACVAARSALAALQQATALIPNPAVLINTIPLLEAQASSEIENVVTTADAMFRQERLNEREADAATKEALRYRTALRKGFESLRRRPLSTRTAEEVCTTIKDVQMAVRKVPGTTLVNGATDEVIYTPPAGEALLRQKLANWERFMHADSGVDPVIRMAVAHYQFEAIHPFTDGNGRTGRVLNLLFLIEQRLLTMPVLYLSRYIIRNKMDYYSLLLGVTRDANWEPWIIYMLAATAETATWTNEKIAALRDLIEHTAHAIKQKLPKIYSRELIDAVFLQPYCRIENLVEAGVAKRQTASVYLKELVAAEVLEERKAGRDKIFVHSRFLRLLTRDDNSFKRYGR
jgi:Fic family protein